MATTYRIIKWLSERLVVLDSQYGQQIFSLVRTRKPGECAICRTPYPKGADLYSPITFYDNRWHRLCQSCIHR